MNYSQQLEEKTNRLRTLLSPYTSIEPDIFPSSPEHYRMRVEFRFWREGEDSFYAMSEPGKPIKSNTVIHIDNFPKASVSINTLMPKLLDEIKKNSILHQKLYQVEFLSTQTEDILVTLIYHKQLDENWQQTTKELEEKLNISIVGRSRKQKVILSRDYVIEKLKVNADIYTYHQYEQSFSQPNAQICEKMLEWACAQLPSSKRDLLELYCGNGNFTLPLSKHFRKVLATEISKVSIKALRENLSINHIDNISVARLSAEEFTQAYHKVREFNRLRQDNICLENYDFSTVLVDPPRAGIDDDTLKLLSQFEQILYISCNPNTLASNLAILNHTHKISSLALFDQFPFTPHIECGVLLQKINHN
ncbi:tRNA (uridine(54)-C5)-methyltransferase TrmA [Suttonella ornithocola]|uniref:tRNA/tmRNA (uracil-C(5))-methyltransferase n=1 Tax=Suttonella ornithocola TaxID=279832 RepID=A0A380MW81_9GAMM|nr:tRNA (uridine(54)-C5)-methyltransferase TrmA [Suttonella ornithocola]SUO96542.1 tRNA (uracil(54)-C(5))-methyltransferase [Suttonella ornithocola]